MNTLNSKEFLGSSMANSVMDRQLRQLELLQKLQPTSLREIHNDFKALEARSAMLSKFNSIGNTLSRYSTLGDALSKLNSKVNISSTYGVLGDVVSKFNSHENAFSRLGALGVTPSSFGALKFLNLNQSYFETIAKFQEQYSPNIQRLLSNQIGLDFQIGKLLSSDSIQIKDTDSKLIDSTLLNELINENIPIEQLNSADTEDIRLQVIDGIQRSIDNSDRRLENLISNLSKEIENSKDNNRHNILVSVWLPIILFLLSLMLNPVSDYYVKNELSNRAAKKEIKANITSTVTDRTQLTTYRFICIRLLTVRTKPKSRSSAITSLTLGNAVRLLEQRGAWSLIRWENSIDANSIQGWVYSRYLSKFN